MAAAEKAVMFIVCYVKICFIFMSLMVISVICANVHILQTTFIKPTGSYSHVLKTYNLMSFFEPFLKESIFSV